MTDIPRTWLTPDYPIASIINGCWQLTPDHSGGSMTDASIFSLFDELVEHGFTTFDCADIYTGVEELLGRYRRRLPDPDRIQVHTKLVPDRATLHELTAAGVDAVINRSLDRLGVECLDLVQFHWWDYRITGLDLLTERLMKARQAGKIRLLGVTNFDTSHVRQLVEQGVPVVSLQAQYSLLDQRPEKHMAALAHDQDIALLPYGVLAGGFLSEKYIDSQPPAEPNRSLVKYRLIIEEAGGWRLYQELLQVLASIAKKHGVSLDLVAAKWVLDKPTVKAVILGTGGTSRALKNRRLASLVLDDEDLEAIARQLKQQTTPPGDMYDLERDENSVHADIIKTNLQQAPG